MIIGIGVHNFGIDWRIAIKADRLQHRALIQATVDLPGDVVNKHQN
jgi:hypothetical protein